jgi:putative oxidoreductase
MEKIFHINQIPGYLLIRFILGYVFLVAGLQKFIFPDDMGPGRFVEMGFPAPEFTAYFVGFFETLGGLLLSGSFIICSLQVFILFMFSYTF